MYLDPGTGSMLIQAAIASVAALAVGIGIFRHKIMAFFKRSKNDNVANEDEELEVELTEDSDIGEDSGND